MRMLLIVCVALGLGASAWVQEVLEPYSTGIVLFSPKDCPVFVGGVAVGSPAERAGIRAGDRVLALDGMRVTDGSQASRLFQSNRPTTVVLTLLRGGKEMEVVCEREKRSAIFTKKGQKIVSGLIVPADTTQAEVDRMLTLEGRRYLARVFPTHYPANPELFSFGFEIFLFSDPAEVTVGGIEEGPASKAGIHQGDVLISVNGVPIGGKTPSELEQMLSASQPAPMHLQIDRLGSVKTFEFHLEKAADIAGQNGKRFMNGRLVPIWATGQDLQCFLQ